MNGIGHKSNGGILNHCGKKCNANAIRCVSLWRDSTSRCNDERDTTRLDERVGLFKIEMLRERVFAFFCCWPRFFSHFSQRETWMRRMTLTKTIRRIILNTVQRSRSKRIIVLNNFFCCSCWFDTQPNARFPNEKSYLFFSFLLRHRTATTHQHGSSTHQAQCYSDIMTRLPHIHPSMSSIIHRQPLHQRTHHDYDDYFWVLRSNV